MTTPGSRSLMDLLERHASSDAAGGGPNPEDLLEDFAAWAAANSLPLYPAQEEALIELVSGANVILATPTGSGKSLVAIGAQFVALAQGRRTYYTAPDQGAGLGEVLRPVRHLRRRATSA